MDSENQEAIKFYEKCINDQKQFFKNLYDVCCERVKHVQVNISQDDDTLMLSPMAVTKRFNEVFVSIGESLAINISVDFDSTQCFKTI